MEFGMNDGFQNYRPNLRKEPTYCKNRSFNDGSVMTQATFKL